MKSACMSRHKIKCPDEDAKTKISPTAGASAEMIAVPPVSSYAQEIVGMRFGLVASVAFGGLQPPSA